MIAIMLLQEALFSLHFTWLEAFFLPKATNKLATFFYSSTAAAAAAAALAAAAARQQQQLVF